LAFDLYRSCLEDEEEAVVFLSSIISKKAKKNIRKEIEEDPTLWWARHLGLLGMNIRNALRRAGFDYNYPTLVGIWSSWLWKAVFLPEEEIILTDSVKERIQRYKTRLEEEREIRKEYERKRKDERVVREYLRLNLKDPIDFLQLFGFPTCLLFAGFTVMILGFMEDIPFGAFVIGGSFILPGGIWAAWKYAKWKYIMWKHKKSTHF